MDNDPQEFLRRVEEDVVKTRSAILFVVFLLLVSVGLCLVRWDTDPWNFALPALYGIVYRLFFVYTGE